MPRGRSGASRAASCRRRCRRPGSIDTATPGSRSTRRCRTARQPHRSTTLELGRLVPRQFLRRGAASRRDRTTGTHFSRIQDVRREIGPISPMQSHARTPSPSINGSAMRFAPRVCRFRPESSVRACRSHSSTTGRSRSSSTWVVDVRTVTREVVQKVLPTPDPPGPYGRSSDRRQDDGHAEDRPSESCTGSAKGRDLGISSPGECRRSQIFCPRAEIRSECRFQSLADSKRQKGTRPDFSAAARPEVAAPLYERFCTALRKLEVPVQTGVFGARMQVSLVNDGPVTIFLDVDPPRTGRSP